MNRLRKVARLSRRERRLLARAWLTVVAFRGGLTLLPFRWMQRAARRPVRVAAAGEQLAVDRYAWAVDVASRRVPRASCLTQALALQSLLARAGYPSELRIGVAKDGAALEAHAWLESGGRIVIGGDVDRFATLVGAPRAT